MTAETQIKIDIDRWLQQRLSTVLCDGYDRYRTGDMSKSDAMTATVCALYAALASILANVHADPDIVGEHLTSLVREMQANDG